MPAEKMRGKSEADSGSTSHSAKGAKEEKEEV
jgi:hypothetical protein